RADDCFKTSNGFLVNPGEIANALMSHPGVADVVIAPVPTSAGPLIGAVVETDGVVDLDPLRATAARILPPGLQPQIVSALDRLPRLTGGKADRAACDRILRETSRAGHVPKPSTKRPTA